MIELVFARILSEPCPKCFGEGGLYSDTSDFVFSYEKMIRRGCRYCGDDTFFDINGKPMSKYLARNTKERRLK